MQDVTRSPSVRVTHNYLLAQVLVTLVAVVLAEGLALGINAVLPMGSAWSTRLLVAAGAATITGLLLGVWTSRYLVRRLERLLEISQAWLRGTLSLRIADRSGDDLGVLAGQLDMLAEHLAQDEQDLAQLREYNTRLSDQVRALAVDEERERLARELHDGVKQYLFSLSMTASALAAWLERQGDVPEDLGEMVRDVETTSRTAQRTLTRLIDDLRPAPLQERGLAAALNDYTLLFGAREHILTYLDVQGNDALLPPSVAEALYRVAQEALHNVARHAHATRVDVRLRSLPEQVVLTLKDNGVGFDTTQAYRGLGLGNMQDRVLSVGGRLQIESKVGGGTRVRAEVRLAESRDAHPGVPRLERERPQPTIENWAWLGQRLVIPVGQTWPWLPADQAHLREPLAEPSQGPIRVTRSRGILGIGRHYLLQDQRGVCLARIRRHRQGYAWRSDGTRWMLRQIQGVHGTMRAVLLRNNQPLAAMQHQGRLLSMWSEIVYDDHGYGLSCSSGLTGGCVLTDGASEPVLSIKGGELAQIALRRPVALPLLAMVAVRVMEERTWAGGAVEAGS